MRDRLLESRLIDFVRKWVMHGGLKLGQADYIIVPELRTLQGRPDLVVGRTGKIRLLPQIRESYSEVMTRHTAAAVLGEITRNKGLTVDEVILRLPSSERSCREAIRDLDSRGLICIRNKKLWTTALLRSFSAPLVAIEAKRSLSKRAIFQAKQHQSFSSRSFIAVWHNGSKGSLRDASVNLGTIGIIGVRYDGEIFVARKSIVQKPRNLYAYYYALGSFIGRRSVSHSGFLKAPNER